MALSLAGQQDLLTEALYFTAEDIGECTDKDKQLALVTNLAKDIVQEAKTAVPDASMQMQRMEHAKNHVDSVVTEASNQVKTVTTKDRDETLISLEPTSDIAYRLIQTRLSELVQFHRTVLNLTSGKRMWWCDGLRPDGRPCENEADFEAEFYQCVYCLNRVFCQGCLTRLRGSEPHTITVCSAKHQWLRMPPWGEDTYVGLKAKSVRVPRTVEHADGDERILKAHYSEDGGEEITVEEWKDRIAKEWGFSREELRSGISGPRMPESEEASLGV